VRLRALAAETCRLAHADSPAFIVGLLGLALTAHDDLVEVREISRLALQADWQTAPDASLASTTLRTVWP
jgi:hypothetical protein